MRNTAKPSADTVAASQRDLTVASNLEAAGIPSRTPNSLAQAPRHTLDRGSYDTPTGLAGYPLTSSSFWAGGRLHRNSIARLAG